MTTSRSRSAADTATAADPAPPQRRRALLERTVLDEQVAASRRDDSRPWGVRTWLGPLIALVAIIVAGNVLAAAVTHRGSAFTGVRIGLAVAAEAVLLVVLLVLGRPIARRGGGWRRTFGLDGVRGRDWAPWVFGLLFVYAGRTMVGVLAASLTGGKALAEATNLRLAHPTVGALIALAVVVIALAPVAEELMFRGLLLRTFMRRMRFWPAALLSTALFALFHTYEVGTLRGAVTLACSVAVLGLGNCYLVRISGRLTPAIMVHASFNALALAVAIGLAHS